jgi:hypothetical protein
LLTPNEDFRAFAAPAALAPNHFDPDYLRGVGVEIEKAYFPSVLFQVCGFDSSPTTSN